MKKIVKISNDIYIYIYEHSYSFYYYNIYYFYPFHKAQYFESKALFEKAFVLYRSSGTLNKAMEMCIKGNLQKSLLQIIDDISFNVDPVLLWQSANFFISLKNYEKAFQVYIWGGDFDNAFEVCDKYNICITEEQSNKIYDMVEIHTLKSEEEDDKNAKNITPYTSTSKTLKITTEEKNKIVMKLAKLLYKGGSYYLAARRYTECGDYVNAMNSLISGGNLDRISIFANLCREQKIFIMAAKYLISLDWRSRPELLRRIVSLLQKVL
jgi:intraflagellar transport protein 140